MASKIFFDANVILDYFLERNSNPRQLKKLFKLVDDKIIQGCLTISIIQISSYYFVPAKGIEVSKSMLEMIALKFELIEGSKSALINAIRSDQKDIEDAIHYYIALEHGLDAIVTSDKDFIKLSTPSLSIFSPEGLLEAFDFGEEF